MKIGKVLVLGGSTPGSIGYAVAEHLRRPYGLGVYAPTYEQCDVTSDVHMRLAIGDSDPDAVVFSVGVNALDWTSQIKREDFDDLMATNVWGFLNVIKQLQLVKPTKPFSVVAISSDAAVRPMRTSAVYCASKAALNMAVRVASRELAGKGWRINALSPGKVEGTAMTEYVDQRVLALRGWTHEEAEAYEKSSSALGRKLTPEEVAKAAVALLLSGATGWTGDIVTINGGR